MALNLKYRVDNEDGDLGVDYQEYAGLLDLLWEAEALFDEFVMTDNDSGRFSALACPVCEYRSGAYSVSAGNYQIVKCPDCGLEFTTPNPTDDELDRFYSQSIDVRADPEIVAINAKRNLELLRA